MVTENTVVVIWDESIHTDIEVNVRLIPNRGTTDQGDTTEHCWKNVSKNMEDSCVGDTHNYWIIWNTPKITGNIPKNLFKITRKIGKNPRKNRNYI